MSQLRKALFLDRDGTLIVDRGYLGDPSEVELIAGVREALHGFMARGFVLFLLTNQSGVGRGMISIEDVHACNERMLELLGLPSPGFTEIGIATETPDQPALYRKPSPRFIMEMITKYSLAPKETWMIGDKHSDVQAGVNAGVRAALIGAAAPTRVPPGVWHCRDLAEFATKLIQETA